eukprot:1157079-Pelagomonas_calceolata.AAC.7
MGSFVAVQYLQVRLSIATHLHEIARFISKDCCCGVLTRPLVALLRDESSAVQAAVLPMLNTTLHVSTLTHSLVLPGPAHWQGLHVYIAATSFHFPRSFMANLNAERLNKERWSAWQVHLRTSA